MNGPLYSAPNATSASGISHAFEDGEQSASHGTLMLTEGGRSKYLGPTAGSEWLKDVCCSMLMLSKLNRPSQRHKMSQKLHQIPVLPLQKCRKLHSPFRLLAQPLVQLLSPSPSTEHRHALERKTYYLICHQERKRGHWSNHIIVIVLGSKYPAKDESSL